MDSDENSLPSPVGPPPELPASVLPPLPAVCMKVIDYKLKWI